MGFIAPLIEAVKKLSSKNRALEAEVQALKGRTVEPADKVPKPNRPALRAPTILVRSGTWRWIRCICISVRKKIRGNAGRLKHGNFGFFFSLLNL